MNREAIYSALYGLVNTSGMLVSGGGLFNTITRRPKMWDQYNGADFPVLTLVEMPEPYERPMLNAAPAKVTLKPEFWIYTNIAEDPNVVPFTQLNNCIDAVEAALQPSPPIPLSAQNLGGLVASCYIFGEVRKAGAYADGIVIGIIPLSVVVPA